MSDKVFLDSNVLIYSYSKDEPEKQIIARKLISEFNSFISTQVLQELTNIITKKFNFSFIDAKKTIEECCHNNNLHVNTEDTIMQACDIARQNGFSFYDSLIISSALECGCSTLYTEDMQHARKINANFSIINPFL